MSSSLNVSVLRCLTNVDGMSCIILVEKDSTTYDYGCVPCMPSSLVKVYHSEDDVNSDDEEYDASLVKNIMSVLSMLILRMKSRILASVMRARMMLFRLGKIRQLEFKRCRVRCSRCR